MDDAGHGFNNNIIAVYAFFQKALGLPGTSEEMDFEGFKPEDLKVTPTGQLSTSLGGETAFSINKKEAQNLIDRITLSRIDINEHLATVSKKAKELSGFKIPSSEMKPVFRGRYQRDGYAVEMYALKDDENYVIPLLLFVPNTGGNFSSVIYINPKGKIADASPGGKIEQLVKNGYLVAAPDLLGTGEVRSDNFFVWNCNISVLTGQSLVGVQAGNIIKVTNFLKGRQDVNYKSICAICFDEMCPSLIHAAAFDNSINSITLVGSPLSYKSLILNRFYDQSLFDYTVAGSLTVYDLPDLIGYIAPRKIAMVGPKDQMKQAASEELIDDELSFPRRVFSLNNVPENLYITLSTEDLISSVNWCFENKKTNFH